MTPWSQDAPVVVSGVGSAGPTPEDPRSIPEIVLEAVQAALADAALGWDDVDAVVSASVDLFDGLTASNIAITEVVGAVLKPETRIAADGLCAVVHAACQIHAGAYRTVLVVAHGKASMAPASRITPWAMDPITTQPLGVDFDVCAGLQANVLAASDPEAEERWAWRVEQRRRSCEQASAPSTSDVLASSTVASPLTAGMRAPVADGAFAAILQLGSGHSTDARPAIVGVGHDLGPHDLGERDLTAWTGLSRAFSRARVMAALDEEHADFDLLEPSCCWPHEEELFLAAIGGQGNATLSPEGGLYSGAVPASAGLSRLVAAVESLRARPGSGSALVHGAWGPAGQGQVVAILRRAA